MANLKKEDYLDRENLKIAFDFFDEDHNGSISLNELKRIFVGINNESLNSDLIQLTDANNDGEISD